MKKLFWLFTFTTGSGFAASFLFNAVLVSSPSLWIGNQLGLQEPTLVDCVWGDEEDDGSCMSPFGYQIDNYCDFIGCDQVANGSEGLPIPDPPYEQPFALLPNTYTHSCLEQSRHIPETLDNEPFVRPTIPTRYMNVENLILGFVPKPLYR